MPQPQFSVRILDIVQELDEVRSFWCLKPTPDFTFRPGQFTVFEHPSRVGLQAALTLSSSPLGAESFTVTVKRTGNFGTLFYDEAAVGQLVKMRLAAGNFKLEEGESPICFLGRDYGITASRAFHDYLRDSQSSRSLTLLHEVSRPDEMLFIRDYSQSKLPNFRRLTLADGFVAPPAMRAREGRVTAELLREIFPDLGSVQFFAAGERAEVDYYQSVLTSLALDKAQLHFERWS